MVIIQGKNVYYSFAWFKNLFSRVHPGLKEEPESLDVNMTLAS